MSSNNAALDGAVIGGICAICGSVISAFLTTRWSFRQNQLHFEKAALLRAKQLCRNLLDARAQAEQSATEDLHLKQMSIASEMSFVAAQLTLSRHLDIAVKLWTSNGTEEDLYFRILSTDIGMLINPKVQSVVNQLRETKRS